MKRIAIVVQLAFTMLAAIASLASADSPAPAGAPFVLPATFRGMTVCADCPGIQVTLTLSADGKYALERDYADRNTKSSERGTWSYDETTSQLRLLPDGKNTSPELFALDLNPSLQMLDANGKPIPSAPSNVLWQTVKTPKLEGIEWSLVSIGTQSYAVQAGEHGASLRFDAPQQRVSGFTGCNRIMGPYERSGANGLHIGSLGMTRMMCEAHAVQAEGAFMQALASVASFAIEGDALLLFDKSGAPVARLVESP